MTNIEKVKKIREITLAPMNKINKALTDANGDVDKAIDILVKQKETSAEDIANRQADTSSVFSYVHSNKIGAMIVLASQTDFVAKNDLFTQLAKDICMQIVASPMVKYVTQDDIPEELIQGWRIEFAKGLENKPAKVIDNIIRGKVEKKMVEQSLLDQPYVKNTEITLGDCIKQVSGTVGEKIQLKTFVRLSA